MSAKFTARIEEDGTLHIDVNGVSGPACESLTAELIRGMGEIEEQTKKDEYVLENPDTVEVTY